MLFSLLSNGQIIIDSTVANFLSKYPKVSIVPIARDTSYWNSQVKSELLFSENYHKNWNAGGNNIITGLFKFDWHAVYNKEKINWDNNLKMEYGLNKQEDKNTRKSNDLFDFTSTFGYKVYERWFASSQIKITTQFSNGYDYKNDGNHILKTSFFAPARIFIGAGAKYTYNSDFYIYLSPFTENTTLVLNNELAEKGDINKNGEKMYNKIGPWIDVFWKYTFYKNYILNNKLSVYSDYVYQFGSIDYFDWQTDLSIPLHKYFTISLSFHTKYEKDILFDVKNSTTGEKETRIQFKQILGIGLKYSF